MSLKRDFHAFREPGFVLTQIAIVAAIAGLGGFLLWVTK